MIAIPNIPKPKEAVNVEVIFRDNEGYTVGHKLDCPLIDIVRCGECKYWSKLHGCMKNDDIFLVTDPDDFCSYGERRTDERE